MKPQEKAEELVQRFIDIMKKMDWKKMGFKTEEEYIKFLDDKKKTLMDKIVSDPKLLAVFKRLKDR